MKRNFVILFICGAILIYSCKKEPEPTLENNHTPTLVVLDVPHGLPKVQSPTDNPLTKEGIALGRKLFFDPILSADSTQRCSSCHNPKDYFVDDELRFSIGIDNIEGTRNSMPLFNVAYSPKLFWDGNCPTLQDQAVQPVINPVEMHNTWKKAVNDLQNHPSYPHLFKLAFPAYDTIETILVARALAQFERTLLSGNSKYDKFRRGELQLSPAELRGENVFISEDKGDCFHCHSLGGTFTDFEMRNNGLDMVYKDSGYYLVRGNPADIGKFKTPTLRNIAKTAPYMHDGRFNNLLDCIQHYNFQINNHPNLSPASPHTAAASSPSNQVTEGLAPVAL